MDDLPLPPAFARLIAALREGGWPHFVLKRKVDAYGAEFDNDLEILLTDNAPGAVRRLSHLCRARFLCENGAGSPAECPEEAGASAVRRPGFILAVTDFTGVVFFGRNSFGRGGETSYYCFGYRTSETQPSVICWQNGYWRRVAPDFASFFALWQLAPNRFRDSDVGYWEMEEARITRTAQALSRL